MERQVAKGTQQTSSMVNKSRGFTLIEMSIVITLVALFASLIVPNLVGSRETQRERAFVSALKRLALDARTRAISDNQTLHLTLSGDRFSVSQDGDAKQRGAEILGLDLLASARVSRCQLNGQDASTADWDLRFYPDGTADQGGIEIEVGQNVYVLNVTAKGQGTVDDQLTDQSTVQWQAGTYETR